MQYRVIVGPIINKNEINRRTLSTFSHDENNYKKLDKFLNSRNINENKNSKMGIGPNPQSPFY